MKTLKQKLKEVGPERKKKIEDRVTAILVPGNDPDAELSALRWPIESARKNRESKKPIA